MTDISIVTIMIIAFLELIPNVYFCCSVMGLKKDVALFVLKYMSSCFQCIIGHSFDIKE